MITDDTSQSDLLGTPTTQLKTLQSSEPISILRTAPNQLQSPQLSEPPQKLKKSNPLPSGSSNSFVPNDDIISTKSNKSQSKERRADLKKLLESWNLEESYNYFKGMSNEYTLN